MAGDCARPAPTDDDPGRYLQVSCHGPTATVQLIETHPGYAASNTCVAGTDVVLEHSVTEHISGAPISTVSETWCMLRAGDNEIRVTLTGATTRVKAPTEPNHAAEGPVSQDLLLPTQPQTDSPGGNGDVGLPGWPSADEPPRIDKRQSYIDNRYVHSNGLRRMGRPSTTFLQAVTVLVGLGVLALLLFEPHVEGRNATATLVEIYFHDPFLLFVYVGSIPFFVALFQALKLLGHVGSAEGAFSTGSVRAARHIRDCTRVTIGFVVVGVIILMFIGDERTVALFLGLVPTLALLTLGASATLFERLLKRAVDLQSENDLTV